jgi:membrane fusion protein, copper/silver efflux system
MRNRSVALLVLIVAAGCFFAGYSQRSSVSTPSSASRKILYYVDPMNPGFRAEKPGLAPCGMALEPVYADGTQAGPVSAVAGAAPPGVVQVQPGMEQVIGVRVETVEKAPWSQTIRMPGTVVADENRVYRITAATDGWVKKVLPATTDSHVSKDEILATFYAPEFFSGLKAYLYALRSMKRTAASGDDASPQMDTNTSNLENYKVSLRNLGMTEPQLDAIQRTMQGTDNVEIRSPASGFILNRNVSYGQRFVKGVDLYRIADLSRVWILVDIYDDAALLTKPGMRMAVSSPYLKKPLLASLSDVPPRFDPATRTLKLRLAADNPGYALRPDMFVDVEFKVSMPAALTVPSEAVLDSGLKKSVFVELSPGRYQPRVVETGRSTGDRVEVVKGLAAGERVVVSGNFLLDSESRMKNTGTAAASGTESVDPNCGMLVDQGRAKSAGLESQYGGKVYYFCTKTCKAEFDKSPATVLAKRARQGIQKEGAGLDMTRMDMGRESPPAAEGKRSGSGGSPKQGRPGGDRKQNMSGSEQQEMSGDDRKQVLSGGGAPKHGMPGGGHHD